MEIRRVQITGGSSFMVTLPKEWAESVELKKNDPLRMEVQPNGTLEIYPGNIDKSVSSTKKVIDVSKTLNEDYLYRKLIGAYIAGHGLIEIRSESKISSLVTDITTSFTQASIGLEIIEEDENHILIKDLMDHTEFKPTKSIERMKVLVRNMISDVYESAYDNNLEPLKKMDSRDLEVDRLHWLISRQVNIYQKDITLCNKVQMNIQDITRCLSVSRIIERIGDHAVVLSNNLVNLSIENKAESVDKTIREIGSDIVKLFNDSVISWNTKDLDLAEKCIESGEKIVERIRKAFDEAKIDLDTASQTSLIAGSSKRIGEYCMDISELAINAAMD